MPTFSRSALNPNGSFEADGMDASDQANFNMQNQRQQQSMMAQLALAQLRSGDARFAAERSDNMGMAGINALTSINGQNIGHQDRMAEMQASANRDRAEIGYRTGRDTMLDNRYQNDWKAGQANRDVDAAKAEIFLNTIKAGGGAPIEEAKRGAAAEAANTNADPTAIVGHPLDTDELAHFNSVLNTVHRGNRGAAANDTKEWTQGRSGATAKQLAVSLSSAAADAASRASNHGYFSEQTSGGDIARIQTMHQKLLEALTRSGLPPDEAAQQADDAIRNAPGVAEAMSAGYFSHGQGVGQQLRASLGFGSPSAPSAQPPGFAGPG